jgi:hypothetical protein
MEARELRIGNFVYYANKPMAILQLSADGMQQVETGYGAECGYVGERDLTPIPITEEWLLNFGFEIEIYEHDCKDYKCYKKINEDTFNIFIIEESQSDVDYWRMLDIDMKVEIKHVHQLQNLYFALTGEELTLKK